MKTIPSLSLRCESSFFILLDIDARYYDPLIGRFYSNDPIGFRDVHSFNRYAYANNNPYKYVDPDGKNPLLACVIPAVTPVCAGAASATIVAIGKLATIATGIGILAYNVLTDESSEEDSSGELTEEEIQEIHKDCVKDCIKDEVDKYENNEKDTVDHDEIIKEARKRAEKIIEEKQSD